MDGIGAIFDISNPSTREKISNFVAHFEAPSFVVFDLMPISKTYCLAKFGAFVEIFNNLTLNSVVSSQLCDK